MHSILGLLNVLSSHRDIVGANEYHSYRKCIFEPGERKPFSVVYSYLVLSMLFNFHTSEETVYKAPDAARAFTNPYTSCILCSSWYKILALHIVSVSLNLQTHHSSPSTITMVCTQNACGAHSTSLFLVDTMSSRKDWSSAQESISVISYSTVLKGPKDQRFCFRFCIRYWNIWGEKKGSEDIRSFPVFHVFAMRTNKVVQNP